MRLGLERNRRQSRHRHRLVHLGAHGAL